ncbi:MAG TPA: polysaccharide deacetylase family protein [Fimbriimonadaceae bacterium]|nr:polysaccharide deacetylase family protein [Fimbriimonadaceae bacterium]
MDRRKAAGSLCPVIVLLLIALAPIALAQASLHSRLAKGLNPEPLLDGDPYWRLAAREVSQDHIYLDKSEAAISKSDVLHHLLRHGNTARKQLALTFDDGPNPRYTPALLALLKSLNVKATFFLVGHMAEANPELVKQIATDGYEIGNHTFSHAKMTGLTYGQILTEYRSTNEVLERITGVEPKYCRPSGGDFDVRVLRGATAEGLTTVLWTDDPGDYSNAGANTVLHKELSRLSNGGIILLHDGAKNTMATLRELVARARAEGYSFVTLDQLRSH